MATKLKYYSRDPNARGKSKGRGKGFYYNRTWKSEGYGAKYMSKYNADRDQKYAGRNKTGGSRYLAHTTDKVANAGKEIPANRRRLLSETGKLYGTGSKDTKKYQKAKPKKKYNTKKSTKRSNRYKR